MKMNEDRMKMRNEAQENLVVVRRKERKSKVIHASQ